MVDSEKLPITADEETLRRIAQTLSVGVAIIDPDTWEVIFENACFFNWFAPPEDADAPLTQRMPGLNVDRAKARLKDGRAFAYETETEYGSRKTPLSVELKPLPEHPSGAVVVECHDISKQKQAEYLLESYSKIAEKNARDLEREKDRAERLLLNIMPRSVYDEMKDYGTVTPQLFENASILMIDFVGHTEMEISRDPAALVTELNDMFTVFDRITDMLNCERIRTVGDSYLAVSGLPELTPDHAHNIARVALRMLRYIEKQKFCTRGRMALPHWN